MRAREGGQQSEISRFSKGDFVSFSLFQGAVTPNHIDNLFGAVYVSPYAHVTRNLDKKALYLKLGSGVGVKVKKIHVSLWVIL